MQILTIPKARYQFCNNMTFQEGNHNWYVKWGNLKKLQVYLNV